ncbi:hypothetical protein [Hahella sp. NBU794]|uniref:hypothetical protein n=1 Tax=Hahella sp. NBU794 TaxID=3422590 RepID=UPI003D6E8E58
MSNFEIIDVITSPIGEDYFPEHFLRESQYIRQIQYASSPKVSSNAIQPYRGCVDANWHGWLETYIRLVTEGRFPYLWPLKQYGLGFDFAGQLDDFKDGASFYSLGSDPIGDWFVMSIDTGSWVHLCDHHVYTLYDGWDTPNHLLAWALRVVLGDEYEITADELRDHWRTRKQRINEETLERIIDDLS